MMNMGSQACGSNSDEQFEDENKRGEKKRSKGESPRTSKEVLTDQWCSTHTHVRNAIRGGLRMF